MKFVLASKSPVRKQLLDSLNIKFETIPSDIEEICNSQLSVKENTEVLSLRKGQKVSLNVSEDNVVISCDTLIEFENTHMGKPVDRKDAFEMLKKLSGKSHLVHTGLTVIYKQNKFIQTESTTTKLWMTKLTDSEIDNYLDSIDYISKAGSYELSGLGAVLFERIEGDYFSILGLPVRRLSVILSNLGYKIL